MSNFRIYNKTLNPVLWDSYQHLNPEVRVNLLRMAYDFYEKTGFVAPIQDVYLMGSIASYNWTPESDADVHVIIDFSKLQMPSETATDVVKTAGAQWNSQHNATVKGFKVEMNIQSSKESKPYVSGIYSLVKDEWVRKPTYLDVHIDTKVIQSKYYGMKKYIDSAIQSGDRNVMKSVKKYLDAFRQYGLDTGGELSIENIVFKILRAKGVIKRLKDSIGIEYDKEMSVKEGAIEHPNSEAFWWVSPTAEFFKVPFQNHGAWAKEYLLKNGGTEEDLRNSENTYNAMFKRGWVRVGMYQMNYDWGIEYNHSRQKDPTNAQLRAIRDTGIEHGAKWMRDDTFEQERELQEINQSDLNARHPNNPTFYDKVKGWDFSKLTLDNLKALRDKSYRALQYAKEHPELTTPEWRRYELDFIKKCNAVIKRRISYINRPLMEGQDSDYNAANDFFNRRDRQMCEIAHFLKSHPANIHVPWKTISASLLKRTWLKFGKYNKVDVNDIDKIADQILTNIARLDVANDFQGHSRFDCREEVEDNCGIDFTDEEWDNNSWRFSDSKGHDKVSDYGIEPLRNLYSVIFNSNTPEEKLYACDKALNVVHQRNDLAAMFVEGGSATLTQIANQGGYSGNYNYGDVNKEFREGYGAGDPSTDPKAVGRWTVKYDSVKKLAEDFIDEIGFPSNEHPDLANLRHLFKRGMEMQHPANSVLEAKREITTSLLSVARLLRGFFTAVTKQEDDLVYKYGLLSDTSARHAYELIGHWVNKIIREHPELKDNAIRIYEDIHNELSQLRTLITSITEQIKTYKNYINALNEARTVSHIIKSIMTNSNKMLDLVESQK